MPRWEARIVGCVVLVNHDGKEVYARTAGLADREANRRLERDAIWRLASVTKPIVATAALKMMEAGLLGLDDPVEKYLPYFTPASPDGAVRPITIRQLLSHSSGLSYETTPGDVAPGMSGPYISLEENLRRLAGAPLLFAPAPAGPTGTSIDVVGGVLAAINGSSLETAVKKYAADPLGMVDWGFTPTDPGRVTANYHNGDLPVPSSVPPVRITDENSAWEVGRIFRADAPQSGGGGSCGTADDVMKMLEVYNGGTFPRPDNRRAGLHQPDRHLAAPRERRRQALHPPRRDDRRSAGGAEPLPGRHARLGGGAWGHNWIIDRTNKLTILVCTNVAPGRLQRPVPGRHSRRGLRLTRRSAMDLAGRVDAVVDNAIANDKIVGSVTLVARHGELLYALAAGWFDREAKIEMRRDAIFRLASVTKPIVAATGLAMIERNLLGLDNAVADYLPISAPRRPLAGRSPHPHPAPARPFLRPRLRLQEPRHHRRSPARPNSTTRPTSP